MGMFDTVVFPEPIACAQCGAAVPSTQTHALGELLETYRVGDVADAADVTTGVLAERLYCEACRKFDQPIYLTLWHGLITGVYAEQEQAERNLLAVDRADLLHYLAQHQKEERRLRRLLHGTLSTVQDYAEHLEAERAEEPPAKGPFADFLLRDLKEHLQADDPLKSIVAKYRERLGGGDSDNGWP